MARRAARGLVVAVEGVSGAGKSSLLRALGERPQIRIVEEAWDRLRPRPSLSFGSPRALLGLELRLLEEDRRRWKEAIAAASTGCDVLCDTDFLGPALYTAALARADPSLVPVALEIVRRTEAARRQVRWGVADLYVYLDTPPRIANSRVRKSSGSHPARWRERHAQAGAIERTFWLGWLPALLPGRVRVLDGRASTAALVRRLRGQLEQVRSTRRRPGGARVLRAVRRFVQTAAASELDRAIRRSGPKPPGGSRRKRL